MHPLDGEASGADLKGGRAMPSQWGQCIEKFGPREVSSAPSRTSGSHRFVGGARHTSGAHYRQSGSAPTPPEVGKTRRLRTQVESGLPALVAGSHSCRAPPRRWSYPVGGAVRAALVSRRSFVGEELHVAGERLRLGGNGPRRRKHARRENHPAPIIVSPQGTSHAGACRPERSTRYPPRESTL